MVTPSIPLNWQLTCITDSGKSAEIELMKWMLIKSKLFLENSGLKISCLLRKKSEKVYVSHSDLDSGIVTLEAVHLFLSLRHFRKRKHKSKLPLR